MIRSLNMRRQPCIHFFDIIMRRESVSPPKFLLDFLQDFDYPLSPPNIILICDSMYEVLI